MTAYRRPSAPPREFRDAVGRVIDYGSQWGEAGPPDDAYSVDSHPERFAPLHDVADAIITDLVRVHDVTVEDDPGTASDLLHPFPDVVRAVRLTPALPDSSPLTFVFTGYPGVALHAGLVTDFHYPVCGCDACDETWPSVADEVEWQAFAVARGRFHETWQGGRSPRVGFALHAADGSRGMSGDSVATELPAALRVTAEERLGGRSILWQPWPRRQLGDGEPVSISAGA
jgi:hypothetical protein